MTCRVPRRKQGASFRPKGCLGAEASRKGQLTAEVLVSTVIMLLALVIIFQQSGMRSDELEFRKASGVQKTDCLALQSAISTVQSVPENAQAEVFVNYDFNVAGNSINFSGFYCYFNGNEIEAQHSRGNVRVIKVDGNVRLENF